MDYCFFCSSIYCNYKSKWFAVFGW